MLSLFTKLYGISLTTFLVLDFIWLGFVAKKLYQQQLGFLMTTQVNWAAALLFYAVFIVGLVVFVIQPHMSLTLSWQVIAKAALFGFVTYATYDLTNLATIKGWPFMVTVIDLLWGTTLSVLVTSITLMIAHKLQ